MIAEGLGRRVILLFEFCLFAIKTLYNIPTFHEMIFPVLVSVAQFF